MVGWLIKNIEEALATLVVCHCLRYVELFVPESNGDYVRCISKIREWIQVFNGPFKTEDQIRCACDLVLVEFGLMNTHAVKINQRVRKTGISFIDVTFIVSPAEDFDRSEYQKRSSELEATWRNLATNPPSRHPTIDAEVLFYDVRVRNPLLREYNEAIVIPEDWYPLSSDRWSGLLAAP